MTAVALEDAKAHLRIGFDTDDAYVTSLLEAAEGYVQEVGVAFASPLQPAVRHAILLLVSHWYGQRDAAGAEPSRAIAFGVDALLSPYREWTV